MASDRDVLLVVEKAHRGPIDEVRLEFDPLAYKVPPHVTLVYAEEGKRVTGAAVSKVASQLFRLVLRFDQIKVVGDRNVWLMADEESSAYVESVRKELLEGKCNPRIALGRGKDRSEAEKIREFAQSKLKLPLVLEFGEVLHEEILVDGSSRVVGRFPLRQDQLVFQATRAARWLWNCWPFEAGQPHDVARTAYRLLADLVPFDEETIEESSWKGIRRPEEPPSRFDVQELAVQGVRALAGLKYDTRENRRHVEVYAHSLPAGTKARDAEPMVAEIRRTFADGDPEAVHFFLWGDRRADKLPDAAWHADSVQTLGRVPDEVMFDVPPGLELRRETTVEFMEEYTALYEAHRKLFPKVAEHADAEAMRRNLSFGGVLSLRDAGKAIGIVGWQLAPQPVWDVPCHFVDEVIVAPERRGRGFGKVLRAVAAKAMDRRASEFQAGRIRAYNTPSLSGALANGRSVVATQFWADAGEGRGWPRYSM